MTRKKPVDEEKKAKPAERNRPSRQRKKQETEDVSGSHVSDANNVQLQQSTSTDGQASDNAPVTSVATAVDVQPQPSTSTTSVDTPISGNSRKKQADEERKAKEAARKREYRRKIKQQKTEVKIPPPVATLDDTASENTPTILEEPQKKKHKDFTQEERRAYSRLSSRKSRAAKKASQPPATPVDQNVANADSLKNIVLTTNDDGKILIVDSVERKSMDDVPSTTGNADPKKTQSQMTKQEYNAYKARKMGESRAEIDAEMQGRKRKPTVVTGDDDEEDITDADNPSKKRCGSDETEAEDKIESEPSDSKNRNCKVRISCIDLFEAETAGIVIPHYRTVENSLLFQRLMSKFTETNIDTIEQFKEYINDKEQTDKRTSFKAVSFNWATDKDNGTNRMSIHVSPPVAVNGKYHVLGEAHLRASYFSSLMEADRTGLESVAIPLLGLGMPTEKSAAIGLQMIFAYMHSVKETNLKLIYLVTRKEVYNKVGKMFGYVREFDLNKWTTRDYLNYEKHIFDRVKEDNHFSSIPGTDMVWRAFKVTHERGWAKDTTRQLNEMHRKMHEHTGTKPTMFLLRRKKYDPHMMAKEFVKNGVKYAFEEAQNSLLDIRFNTSNFCGSNQVLRKLWIISNYHMYFQEHTGDALNLDPKSEQYKIRKRIFNQQKQLHADVVRLWNKTYKHAPFKCDCTLEHGYHENMVVFMVTEHAAKPRLT